MTLPAAILGSAVATTASPICRPHPRRLSRRPDPLDRSVPDQGWHPDWPAGGCDPGPCDLILAEKDREVNFPVASWHPDDRPGPGRTKKECVMTAEQRRGIWDGSECALVFIDYQDSVIADVCEQDRRVVELHARTLAMAAVGFGVPVALSTVAVKMGKNTPIMPSLQAAVPGVEPIGRSTMDAWEDPAFLDAA